MPSEPTREELLAQIAALQSQLRQQQPASLFVREVSGVAPPSQPALKTSQATQPQMPTAQQRALALALDPRLRQGKQTPEEVAGQIAALKVVISSGVNSAAYGDKRTEFRSLNEMRQILNDLEEELAGLLGMGGRVRQIRMTTQADKGL
jgi:hypothetical protein